MLQLAFHIVVVFPEFSVRFWSKPGEKHAAEGIGAGSLDIAAHWPKSIVIEFKTASDNWLEHFDEKQLYACDYKRVPRDASSRPGRRLGNYKAGCEYFGGLVQFMPLLLF